MLSLQGQRYAETSCGRTPRRHRPALLLAFRTMRLTVILLAAAVVACKADPIEWTEPSFEGHPVAPSDFPHGTNVEDAARCPASMRATSNGRFQYAAWWRVRSDSSALLIVARSHDGSSWENAVVADSSDRGVRGCARPAPAIAADSESGYVHLAYFLEPAAGAGIFFAHSMDSAKTFHAPVPIVFGRNSSRVSVASSGDRVAVAFEDPNSRQPLIGVALSRTMGHLFEERVQATPDNGRAMQPVIRIDKDSVRLWWSEYSSDSSISATRSAYRAAKWK